MRFAPILFAILLAIPFLSSGGATQTCSSLDRNVPAAGASVHAHTESCSSVDVYGAWTYTSWYNLTTVQVLNLQGESVSVGDYSAHYVYTDGVTTGSQYIHSYGVNAGDGSTSVGANAFNNQYRYTGYGCQEATGLGGYHQSPSDNGGIGETLYGGSNAQYVLPCTDDGTQQTLP